MKKPLNNIEICNKYGQFNNFGGSGGLPFIALYVVLKIGAGIVCRGKELSILVLEQVGKVGAFDGVAIVVGTAIQPVGTLPFCSFWQLGALLPAFCCHEQAAGFHLAVGAVAVCCKVVVQGY